MAKPLMSDAEMRRRQKLQGKIGRTTSTLGLSGVALTGAAIAVHKKPGSLKAITKVPGLSGVSRDRLKNAAFHTSIAAGGIGGVGGFNQASIYSAESRKRKAAVVKKGLGMEMGYYGEEGNPLTHEEIEAEIEKAWSPSASNFDPEASRKKRSNLYQGASLAGAGAGGAYAAHHGRKAVQAARGIVPREMTEVHERVNSAGKKYKIGLGSQGQKAVPLGALKKLGGHGGKSAAGLAAVGGAAATHSAIRRKKQGSWEPYAKSAHSAFGIEHTEEVSKLGLGLKPTNPMKQFSEAFKHTPQIGAAAQGSSMKLNKPTRAGMFVSRNRKPLGAAGVAAGAGAAGGAALKPKKPQ